MANELATRGNNSVAPAASGNPFLNAASSLGGGDSGVFIKFSGKTGEYTYGAEQEELEDGWKGAVNIAETAKLGWICWKDSEVVGEDMSLVLSGTKTAKSQLEDHGPYDDDEDGWTEQFSVELVELDIGEQMLLKNSSKSGLRAFGNLLNAYGKAIQKGQNLGDDGEELIPVVEFSSTEFTPKNGKKKDKAYAPKFTIVDWISQSELQEQFGGEDDPENYDNEEEAAPPAKAVKKADKVEKAPAKKTTKPAKEEEVEDAEAEEIPADEEEAPAETGRRRRRF